jgi:hypothetical protein
MLKFSTDPRLDPCRLAPHVADPLVAETIALFGGRVLLEGSAETACPPDPFHTPGVTALPFPSSAMTDERDDTHTRYFCETTIADIEATGDAPIFYSKSAFEIWLEMRWRAVDLRCQLGYRQFFAYASLCREAIAVKRELPGCACASGAELLDRIAYPTTTSGGDAQ